MFSALPIFCEASPATSQRTYRAFGRVLWIYLSLRSISVKVSVDAIYKKWFCSNKESWMWKKCWMKCVVQWNVHVQSVGSIFFIT